MPRSKRYPARLARLRCQHLQRYPGSSEPPCEGDVVLCSACDRYEAVLLVYPARRRRYVAVCGVVGRGSVTQRDHTSSPVVREFDLVCTLDAHEGDDHYDETYCQEFTTAPVPV